MSNLLQQAIFAVQTHQLEQARHLLNQLLQAEPRNVLAWVWLAKTVRTPEWQRACLDRALAIDPDNEAAQQGLLEWVMSDDGLPARSTPAAVPVAPSLPLTDPILTEMTSSGLKDFLLKLYDNYNTLQIREASYAVTAAPIDLLNQIDDYARAIDLTEQALELELPLEEVQAEFRSLNLQINQVVFVTEEPPRKPFTGINPYRGLLKFTEDDARFFFGRTAVIDSLLEMVRYLVETPTSRQIPDLLAVLGPSGSGKSSLVRAGLIPALRDGRLENSQQWLIKVMLPGEQPLEALARVFEGEVGRDLDSIRAKLAEGGNALHDLMVEALDFARKPATAIFGLAIDQFEELFTLCDDADERHAVIDMLLQAVSLPRNRSLVVLTMRSDFYSKVAAHKSLAEAITQHQMLVSPLTQKELREAILLPAEAVGLELEKELVEWLLADTRDAPGVLPLLQHALLELFNRREGNLLTMKAYDEIGGVEGALAHRANSVVGELGKKQQQAVRRIFMRLVRPGEGTVDTRRRATLDEVGASDEVEAVVYTLADANLLITSRNPDTEAVVLDVSHEALIQKWPLLRHWLDEDREGLRIRQQLSQVARDWDERKQDEDSLYRGAKLLEVEEWAEANPGEMNALELAFVEASVGLRNRQTREKEEQRQRELEQQRALAEEQRKRIIEVQNALSQALYQNRRAKANELAALADADSNPNRSLALSLEAAKITWNEDGYITYNTSKALQKMLSNESNENEIIDWEGDLGNDYGNWWVSFSPDGNQLATTSDQITRLWDVSSGEQLNSFKGHSSYINSANFSPDGKYIVTASDDGTAIIWSTTRPVSNTLKPGSDSYIGKVRWAEFAKDNNRVITADENKVRIWDVTKEEELNNTEIDDLEWIWIATFSPDNARILVAGEGGESNGRTITILDAQTLDPVIKMDSSKHFGKGGSNQDRVVVLGAEFSPDGEQIVTAHKETIVLVWNVKTGDIRFPLSGQFGITSARYSRNGDKIITGNSNGSITIWDAKSGKEIFTFSGFNTNNTFVDIHPNDKQIAAVNASCRMVKVWPASPGIWLERIGSLKTYELSEQDKLLFGIE